MPRFRVLAFVTLVMCAPLAAASATAATPANDVTGATRADTTPTETTIPVTDTTFVWDLEKEPSECIGFLPKPGCGKEPQQAGDRGGALQWAVFGVIIAGVATVGTVLGRNVVRRDREIARRLRDGG
ncbi:MAG: hypothetical protein ACKOQ1_06695 [Actinomycetota bacterium]